MLIKELFDILPKTIRNASYGSSIGKYPFFTFSNKIDKYVDEPDFNGEFLIIGDGGTGNCKYINGYFSASDHNYLLKPKAGTNCKAINYFLQRNDYEILNDGFRGVGLKNISKTYIEKINYKFNAKYSEKYIVKCLDCLYDLIENEKSLISLYDELIKLRFNCAGICLC